MTSLVVGVDGGGTGSRTVLVDEGGRELARVEGGPAVAGSRADGPAVAEVTRIVRALLAEAEVEPPVEALWAGLAGAGREETRAATAEGLRRGGLAGRVGVGTDVEAAFQDAFGPESGILLVAGTGSVARGRGEDGAEARAGGWGPVVGDEGSGWAVGREALRAVLRAEDGRGPATRLRAALLAELELDPAGSGAETAHRIVAWSSDVPRARVAALAPVVVRVAREGDAVAAALVERAVRDLVVHATALEAELGPWAERPRVALHGGLVAPGRPLREAVEGALVEAGLMVIERDPDGARGAAALARALAG